MEVPQLTDEQFFEMAKMMREVRMFSLSMAMGQMMSAEDPSEIHPDSIVEVAHIFEQYVVTGFNGLVNDNNTSQDEILNTIQ